MISHPGATPNTKHRPEASLTFVFYDGMTVWGNANSTPFFVTLDDAESRIIALRKRVYQVVRCDWI